MFRKAKSIQGDCLVCGTHWWVLTDGALFSPCECGAHGEKEVTALREKIAQSRAAQEAARQAAETRKRARAILAAAKGGKKRKK